MGLFDKVLGLSKKNSTSTIISLENKIAKAGSPYVRLEAANKAIEIASSDETWPDSYYPRRIGLGNFLAMKGSVLMVLARDDFEQYYPQALDTFHRCFEVLTPADSYPWALLVSYYLDALDAAPTHDRKAVAEEALRLVNSVTYDVTSNDDLALKYRYHMRLAHLHIELASYEYEESPSLAIAALDQVLSVVSPKNDHIEFYDAMMLKSICYSSMVTGDRIKNQELAVHSAETALASLSRERYPDKWAHGQITLSMALSSDFHAPGKLEENTKKALQANDLAKDFFTTHREHFPDDYAMVHFGRIKLFKHSKASDREAILKDIDESAKIALAYYTQENYPREYSEIMTNLGLAKADHAHENDPHRAREALDDHLKAVEGLSKEDNPLDWIDGHLNLAKAYVELPTDEDSEETIEKAIEIYQECLRLGTAQHCEKRVARVLPAMAVAYAERLRGDFWQNLEISIGYDQKSLQASERLEKPVSWAGTASNLAESYIHRPMGDRADNLELALSYIEAALSMINAADNPRIYARLQLLYARCHRLRIRGNRLDNLKEALIAYRRARHYQIEAEGLNLPAIADEKLCQFEFEMNGRSLDEVEDELLHDEGGAINLDEIDNFEFYHKYKDYFATIDRNLTPQLWIQVCLKLVDWLSFAQKALDGGGDPRRERFNRAALLSCLESLEAASQLARDKRLNILLPEIAEQRIKLIDEIKRSYILSKLYYDSDGEFLESLGILGEEADEYLVPHFTECQKIHKELVSYRPYDADTLRHLKSLVDLAVSHYDLKQWDEALVVFSEADQKINVLLASLRNSDHQSEQILEIFKRCSDYGMLSAIAADDYLKAIYFWEQGRQRILSKASSLDAMAFDLQTKNEIERLTTELRGVELELNQGSVVDRKFLVSESQRLRAEISKLYGSTAIYEPLAEKDIEGQIHACLSAESCLAFPAFGETNGTILLVYKKDDQLSYFPIESISWLNTAGLCHHFSELGALVGQGLENDSLGQSTEEFVKFQAQLGEQLLGPIVRWIPIFAPKIKHVTYFPDTLLSLLPLTSCLAGDELFEQQVTFSLCQSLKTVVKNTSVDLKQERLLSVSCGESNRQQHLKFAPVEASLVMGAFDDDRIQALDDTNAYAAKVVEQLAVTSVLAFCMPWEI